MKVVLTNENMVVPTKENMMVPTNEKTVVPTNEKTVMPNKRKNDGGHQWVLFILNTVSRPELVGTC